MTGLQTATLVQQTALPPDAWVASGSDDASLALQGDDAEFYANTLVPVAHVQPPTGAGDFTLPTGLSAVEAQRGKGNRKTYTQINTGSDGTLLLEVTSASSAAAGMMASPSMMSEVVEQMFPGVKNAATRAVINRCLPMGMETTASPIVVTPDALDGYSDPDYKIGADAIEYRFIDGAYYDDVNGAAQLARMMKDCEDAEANGLDCSGAVPYRMLIADDGGHWTQLFCKQDQKGDCMYVQAGRHRLHRGGKGSLAADLCRGGASGKRVDSLLDRRAQQRDLQLAGGR